MSGYWWERLRVHQEKIFADLEPGMIRTTWKYGVASNAILPKAPRDVFGRTDKPMFTGCVCDASHRTRETRIASNVYDGTALLILHARQYSRHHPDRYCEVDGKHALPFRVPDRISAAEGIHDTRNIG